MDAAALRNLHRHGERVRVFWPGGLHDFVMEFDYATPWTMQGERWADWFLIVGVVVEPAGIEHHVRRSFFVHPVAGGYALVPREGEQACR